MPNNQNSNIASESELRKKFSEILKTLKDTGSNASKEKLNLKEKVQDYSRTQKITDYFRTKTKEYADILENLNEHFNDNIKKEEAALENIKRQQEELEECKQKLVQLKATRRKNLYGSDEAATVVFSKKELNQYISQIENYLRIKNWPDSSIKNAQALCEEAQTFINKKLIPSEDIIKTASLNLKNISVNVKEMEALKKSLDKNFEELKKAYSGIIKSPDSQESSYINNLSYLWGIIGKTLTTAVTVAFTTAITEKTKSLIN